MIPCAVHSCEQPADYFLHTTKAEDCRDCRAPRDHHEYVAPSQADLDIARPLVVVEITGGCVQGEYLYEGEGRPLLFTLDFDTEGLDPDDLRELADEVEGACDAMALRTEHPDDLVQISSWRMTAAELRSTAAEIERQAVTGCFCWHREE